jgi:ElaB/YqjD/DUF883 family membrane-anchored ribosome-binding protein
MARNVDDMIENGRNTAKDIADKVANKARQATSRAEDMMGDNTWEDLAEATGKHLRHVKDEAEDTLAKGRDYTEEMVQNKPFVALGAAFLAGAVFSRLFQR